MNSHSEHGVGDAIALVDKTKVRNKKSLILINLSTVPNFNNDYKDFLFMDLIDNSIITDTKLEKTR